MSYQHVPLGSALSLELLLPDGVTDKYPQAHVYDGAGSEVVGSPFNLTHAANGWYRNTSYTPAAGRFSAIYITYNDALHTVPSTKHGRTTDYFEVDARISEISAIKTKTDQLTFTGSNVNADIQVNSDKTGYSLTTAEKENIADRVWDEERGDHTASGSFGEALQGVLTTTRAANLDYLDVSVSSRQSEANALSRYTTLNNNLTAVKSKTDQLQFTAGNVHADAKVVSDKTGYQTTSGDKDTLVDLVWNEARSGHTNVGSFGESNQGVVSDVRAANLDNLDVTVSSRQSEADALSRYNETQSDLTDIEAKIDTIDTVVDSIEAKVDIVDANVDAVKAKTDVLTFTGSNVNAEVKVNSDKTDYALSAADKDALVDLVWNEARSGHTNVGSFGESNQGVISDVRAANLDNLDVTVSSRQSEADALSRYNETQSDLTNIESKVDIVDTVVDGISTELGVVHGKVDIIDTVVDGIDTQLTTVHGKVDVIDSNVDSIGLIVTNIENKVDIVDTVVDGIKVVTDKFTFTGSYVNAQTKVNEDKADYALTIADKDALVDLVWNEVTTGHTTPGTTGKALIDASSNTDPNAIAGAVWDSLIADHTVSTTFGGLLHVIDHTTKDNFQILNDGVYGNEALKNLAVTNAANIIAEVNQNETKIDAIVPAITIAKNQIIAEVNENEVKIDNLVLGIIAAKDEIIVEVDQNEVKIDAVSAQVGTIQNNTTHRFVVPDKMMVPTVGNTTYQFHLRLFDVSGAPKAPDSTPTIRIRNLATGLDIVVAGPMTYMGTTGAYYYDFIIASGSPQFPVLVEATVVEGGVTKLIPAVSEITEYQSDLDAIQAQLTLINGVVNSTQSAVTNPTFGLSAIKSGHATIIAEVDQNEVKIDLVKAKTDLIPVNPATQTDVASVSATVLTRPTMVQIQAALDVQEERIRGIDNHDLTDLYDKYDTADLLKSNDPRLDFLDVAISTRSTLTAAQVWGYATRTLTSFVLPTSEIDKIWEYTTGSITNSGSIGMLIKDNLDVKVSTRATQSGVDAALVGVAQESTLNSGVGQLLNKHSETQTIVGIVSLNVQSVKVKTDALPADPASQSALVAKHNTTQANLDIVDGIVDAIKLKTDNLPVDPAREVSVQARPTNPVLTTDPRLSYLNASISSRSTLTTADLANLATSAGVTAAKNEILVKVNTVEGKVDTVQSIASSIKTKTDNLPVDPTSEASATANKDEILTEIADLPASVGDSAALEVWSYATRELTTDPNEFKADVSDLATKTDVTSAAVSSYKNRMSTVYDAITGEQRLIAWAEKNGVTQPSATDCTVSILNSAGTELWSGTAALPNADGVFSFVNAVGSVPVNANYYVQITIRVGGILRTSTEAFFTVG